MYMMMLPLKRILVNIYMRRSLHNMHIYMTIYVQMAPNNNRTQ